MTWAIVRIHELTLLLTEDYETGKIIVECLDKEYMPERIRYYSVLANDYFPRKRMGYHPQLPYCVAEELIAMFGGELLDYSRFPGNPDEQIVY